MEANSNWDLSESEVEVIKKEIESVGAEIDRMLAQIKQQRLMGDELRRTADADHERIRSLQSETRDLIARLF